MNLLECTDMTKVQSSQAVLLPRINCAARLESIVKMANPDQPEQCTDSCFVITQHVEKLPAVYRHVTCLPLHTVEILNGSCLEQVTAVQQAKIYMCSETVSRDIQKQGLPMPGGVRM